MSHPLTYLTRPHLPQFTRALAACDDGAQHLVIDLGPTQAIDSTGAAALWRLRQTLAAAGRTVSVVGASEHVAQALQLYAGAPTAPGGPPSPPTLLQSVGDAALHVGQALYDDAVLSVAVVRQWPSWLRTRGDVGGQSVLGHMLQMGCHAAFVVMLIAFLVGITVALQSAAQLRQFGAGLLVADLIGVAVTRELGPLMAAILVAGRTGSAIAAELATMVITEELDALRIMGINPIGHLVVPRMMALLAVQPLLTMMANAIAVLGGLAVAMLYLDLAPMAFVHRLQEAVTFKDIYTGLIKSVVFAWLIVITGAASGLGTRGGPEAVGRSTTKSVVAAIFAIIVADAAASILFYFGANP